MKEIHTVVVMLIISAVFSCASVTAPLQISRSIELHNIYQITELSGERLDKTTKIKSGEKHSGVENPPKSAVFYETSEYYFFIDRTEFHIAKEQLVDNQLDRARELLVKILSDDSQTVVGKETPSSTNADSERLLRAKVLNNLAIIDFLQGHCLAAKEKINEVLEPLSRFPEVFANNRLLSSCLKDFSRPLKLQKSAQNAE